MKTIARTLLLLATLSGTPALAADVQVIAHPAVTAELSASDVKDIFLGAKSAIGGTPVEPVLSSAAAHEPFLKTYVGKTDQGLRNHLKALVFTGKASMPKSFASDAEVIKYVAATKGAIGYVTAGADATGVKKIQVR